MFAVTAIEVTLQESNLFIVYFGGRFIPRKTVLYRILLFRLRIIIFVNSIMLISIIFNGLHFTTKFINLTDDTIFSPLGVSQTNDSSSSRMDCCSRYRRTDFFNNHRPCFSVAVHEMLPQRKKISIECP
jgi:hypothetical protein